jgi:hypothetical protein
MRSGKMDVHVRVQQVLEEIFEEQNAKVEIEVAVKGGEEVVCFYLHLDDDCGDRITAGIVACKDTEVYTPWRIIPPLAKAAIEEILRRKNGGEW